MTQQPVAAETADRFVGRIVHGLMWEKRISQTRMAHALGLAQPNVSRRLRGDVSWALDELYTAAGLLGVSITELLPPDGWRASIPGDDAGRPPTLGEGWQPVDNDSVRHEGLEPPTRCLGITQPADLPADEDAIALEQAAIVAGAEQLLAHAAHRPGHQTAGRAAAGPATADVIAFPARRHTTTAAALGGAAAVVLLFPTTTPRSA